MHSGIILIDKPAGMSSAGVVARVKRTLGAERVGHAGTLDPDATGLLVVLVNGATRVASYAADGIKRYTGRIRLGITTTTDDLGGDIIEQSADIPVFEAVREASTKLAGTYQQLPPKVSAKKVGGKRAYDMTRRGVEFELTTREVTVSLFGLTAVSVESIEYEIECSPGTYVRAIARDLGSALGCGAAVESIRRERSGPLSLDGAIQLEQVEWGQLKDWAALIPHIPRVTMPEDLSSAILNGHQKSLAKVRELPQFRALPRDCLVAYASEGDQETLGLLKISTNGEVTVELNVGRYPGQK